MEDLGTLAMLFAVRAAAAATRMCTAAAAVSYRSCVCFCCACMYVDDGVSLLGWSFSTTTSSCEGTRAIGLELLT